MNSLKCLFCQEKPIKAYLVPQDEFIFTSWSVKANWCGECKPEFQKSRENMIKVREELLNKYRSIVC
tara:strand:- start:766 stop:966 length:201 start_codon:yes stop_codon:yes gene_type:complete